MRLIPHAIMPCVFCLPSGGMCNVAQTPAEVQIRLNPDQTPDKSSHGKRLQGPPTHCVCILGSGDLHNVKKSLMKKYYY